MNALLLAAALAAAAGPHFIEDDYPKALALAKQRHLPLFVDAWAPWCHTCRYLRATVLRDPALGKQAGRFVWLALDTEKKGNAAFDAKFPISAWPTLFFIDPQTETASLRWSGSLTIERLLPLLAEGEAAVGGKVDPELAQAHALESQRKGPEAAAIYAKRVSALAPRSAERSRMLERELLALESTEDAASQQRCAAAFLAEAANVPRDAAFADSVTTALVCAIFASESAPWRPAALTQLSQLGRPALSLEGLNADDRSSLYQMLVRARAALGDRQGAAALAKDWLAFLDGEADHAPKPEVRASLDPHRIEAAEAAGVLEQALPALTHSTKDLPNDYNSWARLSLLQRKLGKLDEALETSNQALLLAKGPRRARHYEERAQIQIARGDRTAAHTTLVEAVDEAERLPAAQRPVQELVKIQSDLRSLDATR